MAKHSKNADEKRLQAVRDGLLNAQTELHADKGFAQVIIVTGVPAAGRSEVVNQFLQWMNPKYITVHALQRHDELARRFPAMRRFWTTLPARGEIAIYFLGWYEDCLVPGLLAPNKSRKTEARTVERIRRLEAMLPQDKVHVLKLHLHVDRKTQRRRIAQLRASKLTRWRVTGEDLWLAKHHARVDKVMRKCIRATHSKHAPWHVVDGSDTEGRALEAGSLLLQALQAGLQAQTKTPAPTAWKELPRVSGLQGAQFPARTSDKSLCKSLQAERYDEELERLQGRFALLTRKRAFAHRGAVFAFEGMDAAGKGGAIRRLTAALDARQYSVMSVSAPSPEELVHPYLWRFWRRVPGRGSITIFDRSWYGRVLVERVRDLTPEADWQRAYEEICEFERQLAEHGLIVRKFWLAVSKEEQLERLQARDADPLKRFKVDPEDWSNRRYFDEYQAAAQEMIKRTHTDYAPWVVVEADDKKYARLKVLREGASSIERELG